MGPILSWANRRRTHLLLLLLIVVGIAIVYTNQESSQKPTLLYDVKDWDEESGITVGAEGFNTHFTSDDENMSGMIENLPDGVTKIRVVVSSSGTNYAIVDDIPIHTYSTDFTVVFSDNNLRVTEDVGINYSSLALTYGYVTIDGGSVYIGAGERGYSINHAFVGEITNVSAWTELTIEIRENCIKATIDGNSNKTCGDFSYDKMGIEMMNYRLDNVSIYGYRSTIIQGTVNVFGFSPLILPSYFLLVSAFLSAGLVLFLLILLKEFDLNHYMRVLAILLLVWAIVSSLVFWRIVVV